MNDHSFRMFELAHQGFGCSQILAMVALEEQGKSNSDLIRAMSGLLNGMACGKTCGALTGACCVLGLYAGKGKEQERFDDRLHGMLRDLVDWFESEYTGRYGSIECNQIVANDSRLRLERCPQIVAATFAKIKEILEENGYRLSSAPEGVS
ncbi:MAG TPA: C-GCAxxG-C-C family protein [Terriglobales bacterium]|nr:C-GCAxxG-C-C family protein [Terriglobales bacterium]